MGWNQHGRSRLISRFTRLTRTPLTLLLAALMCGTGLVVIAQPAAAATCANAIACENAKAGTSPDVWDVDDKGDESIEGFTTDISTNVGSRVDFKIHTSASSYTMDIYRMGYYGGDGARLITTVTPSATLPQTQPECLSDASTGLVDCGNWAVSASWNIPSDAVSGVYFAKLTRKDTKASNHVVFVVRNDASTSKIVLQTSDTTWQAYNTWGGNDFYQGQPAGRSYKVSYNRPFQTRITSPDSQNFVFSAEYPMIKFMEGNGYDVSYISGLDTSRDGAKLLNHSTFMTSGHDEYWSGPQFDNVKAARDAGVNMAFFAGNDVYWRTRWEPSIDSSKTANRTLVSYKETWGNAKIDPSTEWTGTFRDPRFASAANGGGTPENSLTGTIFTVNCCSNAIQIPAADGKLRLWRNTAVASQAAGATYTTPEGTLGYEWNEDLDNGFRPAGQIRMSSATWTVPQKLQDYGLNVATGTATHHLTMYKAASGALVFSSGSVQWAWGLDADHDGPRTATDDPMRQATVNLMADLGNQPTTLLSGLVAAAKSTDTTAPTVTISSPAADAPLSNGSVATISGTATDTGGGRIGGVEVSTDGGTTWHPADGRESWTYSWSVTGAGATKILARASDDSLNLSTTQAQRSVNVSCPCSLFQNETPGLVSDSDKTEIEAGVKFSPTIDGFVTGVKFYKGANNTGTHTGTLWTANGGELATGTFSGESSTGWQTMTFASPVKVVAGATYVASYHAPVGQTSSTTEYFSARAITQAPLTTPQSTSFTPGRNGLYAVGAKAFPTLNYNNANYFVSPVFDTVAPPDTTAPRIVAATPSDGVSSIPPNITPSVTASEPIAAGTLTLALTSPSGAVAGKVTWDSGRTVATFTPTSALARGVQYTITASGAKDDAGNAQATAWTSTFRTSAAANAPGVCPCTIFSEDDVPALITATDTNAVTLGVRFSSTEDGFVSGLKFYKGPQNVGSHVGKLWDSAGNELASATFTGESTSGWQEVRFASKVAVVKGSVYTVGYFAPVGLYSATINGLSSAVTRAPLTAIGHNADGKPNGVYAYGANPTFPAAGAGSNYWVDPIFESNIDTTPPSVVSSSPASGASSVKIGVIPTVTMSEKVASGATVSLSGPSGTVGASISADAATGRILSVTPSGNLAQATTYTVTVNGATDAAGNKMTTPYVFTFTTSGPTACPCTIYDSTSTPGIVSADDTSPVTLGVRFRADRDGTVTGVRFYKGPDNLGTHTGALWNSSGTLLATATFTGETATGWQTVQFATPVAVNANTDYVASYFAPAGKYSADAAQLKQTWSNSPLSAPASADGAPNGLYSYGSATQFPKSGYNGNGYAVDVVFVPGSANDTTPPKLVSTTPLGGSTSVPRTQVFTAVFDEMLAVDSVKATISPATGGAAVPATLVLSADGRTVTVTPSTTLAYTTTYSVAIQASDLAGNAMATPASWSVRTVDSPNSTCPCSLWTDETVPATPVVADAKAVELGTRITVGRDGEFTGVKFYKGASNTGTHVVNVWSTAGVLLRTAVSTGESASGWQQVTLATPLAVAKGDTYIVSYNTSSGNYSATANGFSAAVTRGPLTAPAGTDAAPNGVYRYGPTNFPNNASSASYLVGPVFVDTGDVGDVEAPTVTAITPADGAADVAVGSTVTATFSEPLDPGTVNATLKAADGTAVALVTGYDAPTRRAVLTPAQPLASQTKYTVSLTAADVAGNALAAPATWSFTTADVVPPTVTAVTPADAATGVAPAVRPTATFSEAIDPATLVATLALSGGTAVAAGAAYDATTRTATITPAAALGSQTAYTVSVKASDLAGNALALPKTWGFTTADVLPPTVTAFTPVAGAANVVATVRPTATFSEPISVPSLTAALTTAAGASVPVTTAYDAATRVVTVTPSAALGSAVKYTIAVKASDTAGNAMATSASWTFTTADTVPPVVTAVTATGSGTTATVTWTTDEPSTSTVVSGTTATALTASTTVAGLVTAHSVAFTGLLPNTRYHYRVTSADAANNTTTSPAASAAPAQYAPTVTPVVHDTTATFATGTVASTYVSSRAGGEVVLAPTAAQEFTGTTVPSTWTSTSLATGSAVTVADSASVSGRFFKTSASYASGREIDAVATLRPVADQWLGFTSGDFSSILNTWAAFRTTSTGGLVAESRSSFLALTTTTLSSSLLGTPHRYEIDWTSSGVTFSVDGTVVATQTRAITSSMYVAARDDKVDTSPVLLDSVWISPYAATGTYTSPVVDASASVAWKALGWASTTPTGTAITMKVRTGPNATAGGTGWSAWTTVAQGGTVGATARYLQYQATMTTTTARNASPTLSSVTMAYSVP